MNYSVRIKRSALKTLEKIDRKDRLRLIERIDSLAENPHQGTVLKGDMRGLRRIRTGDYRIVYEVEDDHLLVLVIRVAHRRDVYR